VQPQELLPRVSSELARLPVGVQESALREDEDGVGSLIEKSVRALLTLHSARDRHFHASQGIKEKKACREEDAELHPPDLPRCVDCPHWKRTDGLEQSERRCGQDAQPRHRHARPASHEKPGSKDRHRIGLNSRRGDTPRQRRGDGAPHPQSAHQHNPADPRTAGTDQGEGDEEGSEDAARCASHQNGPVQDDEGCDRPQDAHCSEQQRRVAKTRRESLFARVTGLRWRDKKSKQAAEVPTHKCVIPAPFGDCKWEGRTPPAHLPLLRRLPGGE